MTFPEATYPFPLGGIPNGRYRKTLTQASGGAIDQSGATDLGALWSIAIAQAPVAEHKPEPIEDAGVRAGEIIAYRCWDLQEGLLRSMYADFAWFPGVIERAHEVSERWGTGLHAFKTLERAQDEYRWADVYGEVALWGDVIEHEHGYRAEFAVVRRIIKVSFDIPILRLRRRILQRRYCKPVTSGIREGKS
jgi:hypothetical protein